MFEQYRSTLKLLDRKQRELADMQMLTDTVRGSMAEYPYTQHTMTVCGRNAAEETALRQEIGQLEEDVKRVRAAMRTVPNKTMRLMLELRYMDGLKWDEVAATMDEDVSGDAIRKRVEAFFDAFDFYSVFSENS